MNDKQQALMYDQMINWEKRLQREIPVISEYFLQNQAAESSVVLDLACSTGRHSLALAELGYQTVGVDISEPFIDLARELAENHPKGDQCQFHVMNAATTDMVERLSGQYFDHAILLGNAIANMGNFHNGRALLRHVFTLLKPGGTFFVQTIHRPQDLWYNPLRSRENTIIQRIMVPVSGKEHNVVLHVNQIVVKEGKYMQIEGETHEEHPEIPYYLRQASDNTFFMYTRQEFQHLVEYDVGFEVEAVYHHYSSDPVQEIDGETQTWRLKKPEIRLPEEGIALFSQYNMEEQEIYRRVLQIWQDIMLKEWYHCMRGYRFLYPRIMAHPRYGDIVNIIHKEPNIPIVDLACHMGTDLRQLATEGAKELVGVDLHDEFISAGYTLFGDEKSCTIKFHAFDLLSDEFMKMKGEGVVGGEFSALANYFGVVHAGSLLHLLDEEGVVAVIERVYALLREGGVFFGRTVGSATATTRDDGLKMLHSLESLTQLLQEKGFTDVDVVEMPRSGPVGESSNDRVLQIGFYAVK